LDKETRRLIELVQMPATALTKYPHEFSGGQRQRIGIARALSLRPELLICDESVSALDVSIQAQILNLLQSLQIEFGLTYLFISHDLSVVHYISDRVMVMQSGKIVESGAASQVLKHPSNEYTKRLIAAMP
jgi:peptide/nickel transport system ATP-binding protein